MPKVLLITQLHAGGTLDVPMVLRALGIDCDVMIATSNTSYSALHPIAGVTGALNPNTSDFRNLMRRYDAVFVNVHQSADTTSNVFDPTINTWLGWNAPQDPPVFHFAQVINTRSTLNLPSDFPIIRGNTNDIANTMWRWHPESFGPSFAGFRRVGTRVKFLREGISAYTRAYNFVWASDTECAAYLVDTLLLGASNSELLIVPDFPDQNRMPATPPFTTPAFGVRYRNHYFLPGINYYNYGRRGSGFSEVREAGAVTWILYALKLAGIRPARKIPIVMEFDHPCHMLPFPRDQYGITFPQQARTLRITYEWLVPFCRVRGIQIPFGSMTGSRYTALDGHFWRQCRVAGDAFWGTDGTTQGREEANRIRAILRDNPDVFAFGVHDHTIPTDSSGGFNNTRWDRNGITVTRHSDAGYRYAAPNPIPTRHGTVINRKVAPASYQPNNTTIFEFEKNGVRYLDIEPPTTTAATANFQDGCLWTAKMLLERALAEHADLEIPTIHGYVGYTNHARNWHGGEGYWEAFREFGFRGFRVTGDPVGRRHGHPNGHPYRMRYRELDFVPTVGPDPTFSGIAFYHPAAPYGETLFGKWQMEPTSGPNAYELRGPSAPPNTEWMTSAEWRAIRGVWAIRRYLACAMDMWLWGACVMNGTGYIHPAEANWVDPNNPLGEPFTGTWGSVTYTGIFNFVKELFLAMDELVRVLGDYIKWGTIRELLDFRAAVGL